MAPLYALLSSTPRTGRTGSHRPPAVLPSVPLDGEEDDDKEDEGDEDEDSDGHGAANDAGCVRVSGVGEAPDVELIVVVDADTNLRKSARERNVEHSRLRKLCSRNRR